MNVEEFTAERTGELLNFPRGFVNTFFVIYFVVGLALMAYTPPFQSADSFSHFDRAAGIASGQLIASNRADYSGSYLPEGLINLEDGFSTLPFNPNSRVTSSQFRDGWQESWSTPKVFVTYTTGGNLPFLYLPQVLGVLAGRVASKHILVSFYLAAAFNFLSFIALARFAMLRLPRRLALPLGVFLVFPAVISLATSLNPDALLLALSVVFATMCFLQYDALHHGSDIVKITATRGRGRGSTSHFNPYWLGFACLFLMAIQKPPLALLGLLLPMADLYSNLRRYMIRVSLFAASVAVVFLIWTKFGSRGRAGPISGGGPEPFRQFTLLVRDPVRVVHVLWQTTRTLGWLDVKQSIAGIGWLDVSFPTWFYAGLIVTFVVVLTSAIRFERRDVARFVGGLLVIVATVLATGFSLYILATPYGAATMYNIQGRYLLPLVPVLIVVLGLQTARRPPLIVVSRFVDEYAMISLVGLQLLVAAEYAVMIRLRYWVK
jgi:uncharacterized membrane protein